MDMKLEVVVVPVSDVDRAKAFYSEKVGFKPGSSSLSRASRGPSTPSSSSTTPTGTAGPYSKGHCPPRARTQQFPKGLSSSSRAP